MSVSELLSDFELFGKKWVCELVSDSAGERTEYKFLSRNYVVKYTSGDITFYSANLVKIQMVLEGSHFLPLIEESHLAGKPVLFCPSTMKEFSDFSDYTILKV